MVQRRSVHEPRAGYSIGAPMLNLLRRAEAMGIPHKKSGRSGFHRHTDELVSGLDEILEAVHKAGIAREVHLPENPTGLHVGRIVERVMHALEESPAPRYEWQRMTSLFQPEQEDLAALLGISVSSLRRYSSEDRQTPDDVADRLHFLALLTGDLAGAYNDIGVRNWFGRKRELLDGKAPKDLLRGDWRPGDPGPERVRALGRSLVAASAT